MSFAGWYRSALNRTRNQTPYLAPDTNNVARTTTAIQSAQGPDASIQNKEKKPKDALFGPNIGVITGGPAWTVATEKKVLSDELTPEIVSGWVEKSKDPSQPTTTLQALVNLKRPTIRLSPLSSDESSHNEGDAHHGLEFEYDCDAPKCGIYVYVYLPKDHPDALITAASSTYSKLLVFENVVTGGFGKLLSLEDGATLELDRFEHIPSETLPAKPSVNTAAADGSDTTDILHSADASVSPTADDATRINRRRFAHFHFRRRSHGRSVSGPALAVVDAEPPAVSGPTTGDDSTKPKDDSAEGVKVTIRLAALDEQGTELASPNEQITYLHIVKFGTRTDAEHEKDTQPWVVKVVKREATIGPHTFHLHEIYGLTSSSTVHTHAPTAPLPPLNESDAHTYPPVANPMSPTVNEEDASSECLLCLSNPREVVLLPCRHLVACKDCALNMVEFGAGGNITQTEEPVPSTLGDAAPGGADNVTGGEGPSASTAGPSTGTTPPPVPAPVRRKRKAKGWFCPVCRQPYMSLLRITTTPPEPAAVDSASETRGEETVEQPRAEPDVMETAGNSGLLQGNFLRNLNISGRTPVPDVESQAGTGQTGT